MGLRVLFYAELWPIYDFLAVIPLEGPEGQNSEKIDFFSLDSRKAFLRSGMLKNASLA